MRGFRLCLGMEGAFEQRGLKVNLEKTKLLVTEGERGEVVQVGRYPCGVCGQGVGVNSILCISCNKWCHKRCSGLGRLGPVVDFRCPTCVGGVAQRGMVFDACIRSVLYVGETWALTKRLESVLVGCDQRMLRYMAGSRVEIGRVVGRWRGGVGWGYWRVLF